MGRAWSGEESTGVERHSRQRDQEAEDYPAHPRKAVGMGNGVEW